MAEQSRNDGAPIRKTCGNCTHYRNEKTDASRIGEAHAYIAECRKFPPLIVPVLQQTPKGTVQMLLTQWPQVHRAHDPCHMWVWVVEVPDPLADEPAESMPLPAPAQGAQK